uniref:SH3 domain-containing protein n=1 Tax=Caenorhabditis tropicalis TaxID=1561998 RepID=A0A1I7UJ23_9PELO
MPGGGGTGTVPGNQPSSSHVNVLTPVNATNPGANNNPPNANSSTGGSLVTKNATISPSIGQNAANVTVPQPGSLTGNATNSTKESASSTTPIQPSFQLNTTIQAVPPTLPSATSTTPAIPLVNPNPAPGGSTPNKLISTIPPNSRSTQITVAIITTGDPIPINPGKTAVQWPRTTYTCDKLPDNSRKCIKDMCERMKAIGEQGGDNNVIAIILLIVGIIGIIVNIVVFILRCKKRRKNKKAAVVSPSTADAEAGNALAMKAALVKATEQAKKQEKDTTVEEPSIVSIKTTENDKKVRAKLMLAQTNMDKLRKHVKKTNAQYRSDMRSSKFEKKGPIFIPKEPPIPPAVPLPDGIVLENVTYDPKLNEMWDIGSDVDDIELDESYRINPDSLTESEVSQKSEPKKGKTGEEKKKDATKTGTDDAKTTTDAAEGKDGKEKKEKSVEKNEKSGKKDKSKKDKSK